MFKIQKENEKVTVEKDGKILDVIAVNDDLAGSLLKKKEKFSFLKKIPFRSMNI